MKASDLKKSILQAAVQGKLLPQDKNDEPASELLKRILAEKAALIKAGKLKKEKDLPPITEDEIPYDLPEGWMWCRFQEIASFFNGDRSKNYPNKVDYVKNGIPWINTGHILPDGTLTVDGMNFITEEKYLSLSGGKIMPGDLVFCLRGATFGKVAKVIPYSYGAVASSLAIIRPSQMINVDFLLDILKSPHALAELRKYNNGSAQPNLAARDVAKYYIPLPPFAEQQRIASKVDELMALCDELEAVEKEQEALEKYLSEDLPKAILQSAVQGKLVPQDKNDEPASELLKRIQTEKAALIKAGKLKKEKPLPPITKDEILYDLPDGWVWCRLGQLCQYGVTKNSAPSDIPEEAWVLELEDVEKDTGRVLTRRTTSHYKPQSTKHIFEKGDILYSKLRPYLNKVLIADTDGYCTSEILPLHFSKEINTSYLLFYFRSPLFVEYANSCSYGVKMPRLGTDDGQMALLPLPPLTGQQRIVAKVDELMELCEELKHIESKPIDYSNVVPFPSAAEAAAEPVAMAARGDVINLSARAKQAIEYLFAEDE